VNSIDIQTDETDCGNFWIDRHFRILRALELEGSGTFFKSGNIDLDPGTKKNCDKLAYKSTKIIKI